MAVSVNLRLFVSICLAGGAAAAGTRRLFVRGVVAGAVGGTTLFATKRFVDGPPLLKVPAWALSGKTIFITGASTGLGKETAARLASAGATVVLGARSRERGEAAVAEVVARSGSEKVYFLPIDLSDLTSVKAAASEYLRRFGTLDVLVNNAGVMAIPTRETTTDGFEKQLGVNHLGHFALTALLMPALKKSKDGGRVVNVSSAAHLLAKGDAVQPPLSPVEKYDPWGAYAQSKLANVLFTSELDRRFKKARLPITAVSLHPGLVRTDLARYLLPGGGADLGALTVAYGPAGVLQMAALRAVAFFTRSVELGANTQVWLAAGADSSAGGFGAYSENGGGYFEDLHEGRRSAASDSAELAATLWAESERLTGVAFEL